MNINAVLCAAVASWLVLACGTEASTQGTDSQQSIDAADATDALDPADSVDTLDAVDGTIDAGDAAALACEDVSCPASSHCAVEGGKATCACDAGLTRVGPACMDTGFVTEQCRLSCLELASCGKGSGQTDDACTAACITGAADGEAFAKATCIAMNYEHDTLWCGVVPACDTLAKGDTCTTRCAAKAKCGFLAAPGITSGTSQGECEVLCRAYDTVYGNLKTSDGYATCLQKATTSCDPLELALCEAYNGANICANVCGWLGGDKYCNYIPGRWKDEAACTQECGAWTPKQAHAVFGCYNKLNFAACNSQKALACFNPPKDLPAGVTALTAAVATVCPDAMASKDATVNAWHFLGRTQLWPVWMQNFGGAVECIKAVSTCPSHYDFDWLATCFKTIDPDVGAACDKAQQCLTQSPNKVPYLTVDGTTSMDATRCKVAWQDWKSKEATAFAGVAACLDKVGAADCDAVNGCIAGGNPEGAACSDLVTCWDTAGSNPFGLQAVDTAVCGGLLQFGQDPKVADCVLKAKDCTAKNACLPIQALATNAVPACSMLVPCWEAVGANPFAGLGKLTVGTCAAATSIYNSKNPGLADMIFGCLQNASDCSAKMACLPGQ